MITTIRIRFPYIQTKYYRGQDAYSVLGLRSDENDEVIKSYYKRQALLVHPDKVSTQDLYLLSVFTFFIE